MVKNFFELVAAGLLGSAGLAFVGGLLNTMFDWSIALGGMEMPNDLVSTVGITAILVVLGAASLVVARFQAFLAWLKAHPGSALLATFLATLAIFGAYFSLVGGSLGLACDRGDAQAVASALKGKSYEPEVLNGHLYQVLKKGHVEAARALVDGGADVNRVAGEHQTSLLADGVVFFPQSSVLLLLELGADPNLQDTLGRTAAHSMLSYRLMNHGSDGEDGLVTLLEAMKAKGADFAVSDKSGATLMSLAELHKHSKVAEWLKGQ